MKKFFKYSSIILFILATIFFYTAQNASAAITLNLTNISTTSVKITASGLTYGNLYFFTTKNMVTGNFEPQRNVYPDGWNNVQVVYGGLITGDTYETILFDAATMNSVSDPLDYTVGPPIIDFTATPDHVYVGSSSMLSWSAINATSCLSGGAWATQTRPTYGTQEVTPPVTHDYTLTCTGPMGSTSKQVTVTVSPIPPPPAITFSASPTAIDPGGSSTLTWSVTNANLCIGSGAWTSDSLALSGIQDESPTVASTYNITCDGAGGSTTGSVTVTINSVVTTSSTSSTPPAPIQIVPCGLSRNADGSVKDPCTFKSLFDLINYLMKFILFRLAVPLAALMFAYAGITMLFAGAESASAKTKAKKIMVNVALGLVFVAAAWLIVELVLSIMGYNAAWNWFGF